MAPLNNNPLETTANKPLMAVDGDPQNTQDITETHRAAGTFGTRKINIYDKDRYSNERLQQLDEISIKRSKPIVNVRVDKSDVIRQGLLPLGTSYSTENSGSIGRFFQRLLAWMPWNRRTSGKGVALTVSGPYAQTLRNTCSPQKPVNDGRGHVTMSPRKSLETVEAPDTKLAELLGYKQRNSFKRVFGIGNEAYAIIEQRSGTMDGPGDTLFGDRAPQLSDIRQSDNRQTGHFLALLASVLARPDGAQRIQNIMKDNGDGTVTVRFADVDVRVSKDRLVDQDGNDLFSLGAPWVRIMEKAFLARLASEFGTSFGYSNDLNDVDGDSFRTQQEMSSFRFDGNTSNRAQTSLANLLNPDPSRCSELEDQPLTVVDDNEFQWDRDTCGDQEIHSRIKDTLNNGGSVLATGADKSGQRIQGGHVYSILSLGVRQTTEKNGQTQTEEGYWVFDPYGQSVESDEVRKSNREGRDVTIGEDRTVVVTDGTRGRNARFFVTKEQAGQLFTTFRTAQRFLSRDELFAKNEQLNSFDEHFPESPDPVGMEPSSRPNSTVESDYDNSLKRVYTMSDVNVVVEDRFRMNVDSVKDILLSPFKALPVKLSRDNIEFFLTENEDTLACRIVDVPGVEQVEVYFENDGVVDLHFGKLRDEAQGQGLATGFFQAMLQLADRAPTAVKRMKMVANITVGGYAWARAGFLPTPKGMRMGYRHVQQKLQAYCRLYPNDREVSDVYSELLNQIRYDRMDPRLIRKIAALSRPVKNQGTLAVDEDGPKTIKGDYTLGKACLLGTEWEGTFDLQQDRAYLEAYIGKRKGPSFNLFGKSRSDYASDYERMTWGKRRDN